MMTYCLDQVVIGVWRGGLAASATRSPVQSLARAAVLERNGCGAGQSWPLAPASRSLAWNMARGPGPLTRPLPDTVAMPKRGKRLKFRAQDACSGRGGRGRGRWKAWGWKQGGGWTAPRRMLACLRREGGWTGDLEWAGNLGGEEAEERRPPPLRFGAVFQWLWRIMPTRIRPSWGLEGSRKPSPMLFSRKVGFRRVFSDSVKRELGALFSWDSASMFFLQSFRRLPVNLLALLDGYSYIQGEGKDYSRAVAVSVAEIFYFCLPINKQANKKLCVLFFGFHCFLPGY